MSRVAEKRVPVHQWTMSESPAPALHLIAGPNGAGKSALAWSLLPRAIPGERFVNPDVIATSLDLADIDRARRVAGRRALQRVREFEAARLSFALETTLSGHWTALLAHRLLESGWSVDLTFLWLPGPEAAIERVRFRVELAGGHGIPGDVIRRRFARGLQRFEMLRPIVTHWRVIDRRGIRDAPRIAEGEGGWSTVYDSEAWVEVRRSVRAVRSDVENTERADDQDEGPRRVREVQRASTAARATKRSPVPERIDSSDARLRELLETEVEIAIAVADRATVLRHRLLGIPLIFCEDGRTLAVDAWTVALPRIPTDDETPVIET